MRKWVGSVLIALAVISPARAGSLALSSPSPNPLQWNTTLASPTFSIGVNPTGSPVLYAWQLELMVSPEKGSSGSVSFASATLPASNYVLAGLPSTSGLNPPLVPGPMITLIGDASNGAGATLTAASYNLLDLTFSTSGAKGIFDILAVPMDPTTFNGSDWWTTNFAPEPYSNFPQVGVLLLGTLNVFQPQGGGVPEPGSLLLLIGGMAAVLAYRRLGHARAV